MRLETDTWGATYFAEFARSAFRLEVQPTYTMPSEQPNVARFLGGELTPPDGHNKAWHDTIRRNAETGRAMKRVRVVRLPLTDYQRYGFAWSIPGNVAAGEDVRILDATELTLDLPVFDFWLFDDTAVVRLNFRSDGTLESVESDDEPDLDQYRQWRDLALANAMPFNEWNART
ncbi:MAG TPA: hypothetical protein VGX23_29995 [Actinocrinis sp.]|nr:hypothetical protein [Actinocrinis sp.]